MTKHGSVGNGDNSEVGSKSVDGAVREFSRILSLVDWTYPTGTEDTLLGLFTVTVLEVELRIG